MGSHDDECDMDKMSFLQRMSNVAVLNYVICNVSSWLCAELETVWKYICLFLLFDLLSGCFVPFFRNECNDLYRFRSSVINLLSHLLSF